jgi:hypothetical protein
LLAVAGGQDVIALFQATRDSEYEEILDKCVDFHAGLDKEYAANHFTYGELEENEVELVKLRNWYETVQARDAYGAPKRSEASQALDACSDALELYADQGVRRGRRGTMRDLSPYDLSCIPR